MKYLLVVAIAGIYITLFTSCSSSGGGSGGSALVTPGSKMSAGLGSSVTTIQSIGGAMGTGAFMYLPFSDEVHTKNVNTLAAATKCTIHGEPGTDTNANGVVSDSEKYNQSDVHFALQKFYCTLAAETNGPEAVSGAVRLMKTVVCALEKQMGSLNFDGTARPVTQIVMDSSCASQSFIDNLNTDAGGSTGQSSATLTVAATVTASLNPTFSEVPGNTHFSHGIKIVSNDGTSLKFIILAKFDAAVVGDPVESGNFEFATYGTGSMMQGAAVETTSGKISGGTAATKHLWYEYRANRVKGTVNDPICPNNSSSCGFARHVRLSTDISFANGDIDNVSNFTGIIADGNDSVGVPSGSDQMSIVTATGGLTIGLSGQIWQDSTSPASLAVGSTLANRLTAGTPTCIISGAPVSTTCGAAPAVLAPVETIKTYFLPANDSVWFANLSTHAGIGFSGAATFADGQFVNP